MASIVSITAYQRNQYALLNPNGTPATSGIAYGFPVNTIAAYPAPANTVANGVQMNSLILMYPSGLNQPAEKLYSDATVAALITAINGGGAQTTTTVAPTTTTTAAPTTTTTTAAA